MLRVQKILKGVAESGRVAAAYLFLGPHGSGKKQAAEDFAGLLKCKKQDRLVVVPEGASLKIEQVRELQKWVRYGPSAGPYLAVIVEEADKLTDQAAAAFLKILEEPAAGVVFILLAERGEKILPTISSRCQKVVFPEKAEDWEPNLANSFYEEIKKIEGRGAGELLGLSAKLEKERERIEALLYDLLHFARYKLLDLRRARIILDTVRFIKRKANLKLALDVMCLKLGEKNA